MTDTPKAKRNSTALSTGKALDAIQSVLSTQRRRLEIAEQEILDADAARMRAFMVRVPEADRAALGKMLGALGIEVAPQATNAEIEAEAPEEEGDEPEPVAAPDSVPERLREPLDEKRLRVGRK